MSSNPADEIPLLSVDSTSYGTANVDDSMRKNCRVVEFTNAEENLTVTDVNMNSDVDLGPVVGYAKEPLLPLGKACTPLNSMIYNLCFYVQLALDGTPEQPADGLTIDESASIRLYTIEWPRPHRSLYSMLNQTLKSTDREHECDLRFPSAVR